MRVGYANPAPANVFAVPEVILIMPVPVVVKFVPDAVHAAPDPVTVQVEPPNAIDLVNAPVDENVPSDTVFPLVSKVPPGYIWEIICPGCSVTLMNYEYESQLGTRQNSS